MTSPEFDERWTQNRAALTLTLFPGEVPLELLGKFLSHTDWDLAYLVRLYLVSSEQSEQEVEALLSRIFNAQPPTAMAAALTRLG